jgi:hypothetical protein
MNLEAHIIDAQVRKLVADQSNELKLALKNSKADDSRLKSAAYLFLVIKSKLDLSDDEVFDAIVDGGNDFGVDAIYFQKNDDRNLDVYLFQSKYTQDFDKENNFRQNDVLKLIDNVSNSIFKFDLIYNLNPKLRLRVAEILSLISEGYFPKINIIFCSNGIKWNNQTEELLKQKNTSEINIIFIGAKEYNELYKPSQKISATLSLSGGSVTHNDFDFKRALVGRINVNELKKLFDIHGDILLEKNIRRFLGLTNNRVNSKVADTLRSDDERKNFYFYNNGITVTCSKFTTSSLATDTTIRVEDMQIINGGQTSKVISEVLNENIKFSENAFVLLRLYEISDVESDFISNVTLATNSQSPVELSDLKSNDKIQKDLEQSIIALGFSYKRKRNEKSSGSREFTSFVIAEAVLSVWRKKPNKARTSFSGLFSTYYDEIFKTLNGSQAILAGHIHRFAESKRKNPPENSPPFLAYASRFIAMLIGKQLLEAESIDLDKVNHTNFAKLESLLDSNINKYYELAINNINDFIEKRYSNETISLVKYSGIFRRDDLVNDFNDFMNIKK